MKLKDKKILITGGAGFIGSNLVDYFLENQNEVIAIDNLSHGNLINIENALKSKNFKFIKGDIRNKDLMNKIIQGVDYIFHKAAIASVPLSIEDPISSNDVNVNGTINLLNIAKDSDVKRFVFASSSAIYGDIDEIPIKESLIPSPLSPYGVTKSTSESYCLSFYRIFGLKISIIRYFNVYGRRQADSPYSGVIPIWFGKLLRNEQPILYGDGNQTRDFIYINDIIKINELCALKQAAIGETFNGATSKKVTLLDLLETMKKITKKEIDPVIMPERYGDIKQSVADISKARDLLDFNPQYSIENGLNDFLDYLKKTVR